MRGGTILLMLLAAQAPASAPATHKATTGMGVSVIVIDDSKAPAKAADTTAPVPTLESFQLHK